MFAIKREAAAGELRQRTQWLTPRGGWSHDIWRRWLFETRDQALTQLRCLHHIVDLSADWPHSKPGASETYKSEWVEREPTLNSKSRSALIEWKHVSEELPDDDLEVLIVLLGGEVWAGVRDAGKWEFVAGGVVDDEVTYWADYPDPPALV